jgi:hypothetical protein
MKNKKSKTRKRKGGSKNKYYYQTPTNLQEVYKKVAKQRTTNLEKLNNENLMKQWIENYRVIDDTNFAETEQYLLKIETILKQRGKIVVFHDKDGYVSLEDKSFKDRLFGTIKALF